MRLKHRYIICQALDQPSSSNSSSSSSSNNGMINVTVSDFTAKDIQYSIREKVESLFGEVGAGSYGSSSIVKGFDTYSRIFVVRSQREAETNVRLAISCVTSIKYKSMVIRTLSVAGSVRTCSNKLRDFFTINVESGSPIGLLSETQKQARRDHYTAILTNLEL